MSCGCRLAKVWNNLAAAQTLTASAEACRGSWNTLDQLTAGAISMRGLARLYCSRLQPRAGTVAAQLVSDSALSLHKTSSIEREVRKSERSTTSGLGSFSPCVPFSASAGRQDSGTGDCCCLKSLSCKRHVCSRSLLPAMRESVNGNAGASTSQPCWSCQSSSRTPDTLFCSNCGCLQQVDRSQSYFRLMGVYVHVAGAIPFNTCNGQHRYRHLRIASSLQ